MTTYLVCMDRPLGGPVHFAQHYIGKSRDVAKRLETHRAGLGARILAAANERGITYDVVRVWDGDVEKRLKAHHPRLVVLPDPRAGDLVNLRQLWRRFLRPAPNPRQQLIQDAVRIAGYLAATRDIAWGMVAPDTVDLTTAELLVRGWIVKARLWAEE